MEEEQVSLDYLTPFEVPDLFSVFIKYLITSPIDILYLGAINKLTQGALYNRGAWINAGFIVFQDQDLEWLTTTKMIQRILATHQRAYMTKKLVEIQARQAAAIQKMNETNKILQRKKLDLRTTIAAPNHINYGDREDLQYDFAAHPELTSEAKQALFYLLSTVTGADLTLDELLILMECNIYDIRRQSCKQSGRKQLFPSSYREKEMWDHMTHVVFKQTKRFFSYGQKQISLVSKWFRNTSPVFPETLYPEAATLLFAFNKRSRKNLLLFCRYNMEENLIEECGDFEAYARKYCPDQDFATQLEHLLEMESWMYFDQYLNEFVAKMQIWYRSELPKNVEELPEDEAGDSLLFSNIKLRKSD